MKGYRRQGSGVLLAANAQHALEAIHPDLLARQVLGCHDTQVMSMRNQQCWRCGRFKPHGVILKGSKTFNLKGDFVTHYNSFGGEHHKLEEHYDKRFFVLGWHEIRQLLFEHLPSDVVDFDKQVQLGGASLMLVPGCSTRCCWYFCVQHTYTPNSLACLCLSMYDPNTRTHPFPLFIYV